MRQYIGNYSEGYQRFQKFTEKSKRRFWTQRVIGNKITAIGQRTIDKNRIRNIWLRNIKQESGRGAVFGEQILKIYHN